MLSSACRICTARPVMSLLLFLLLLVTIGCQALPAPELATQVSPTPPPPAATANPPGPTPARPTDTPVPPTDTPAPPTNTPAPPTDTPAPPTATPAPPTDTPTIPPTDTPAPVTPTSEAPQAAVKGQTINVRDGPGTAFLVIASANQTESFEVVGRNEASDWLQICCFKGVSGWVSAELVEVTGDVAALTVPEDMPTPPPTPTPGAAAKPGGGLRGVLLYSVANMDADRWELWQYNFASGENKFLKEWRTEVAFSHDYKQVVYFAWPAAMGDKPGIYVANPDLSGERLVILGGEYPSLSPGGDRLSAQGGDTMYILNSDGSGLHPIDAGEYPAWSPVDNWIAHRGCYGADCGLWLTHADRGERQRLTTGGGDGQPAWSPNGQQLAYISKDDGNFELYRINRDGSNKVRLTNEPHSDGLPVWSPDGGWIAFRSDRSGQWAIYVMRSDGSDVRKVIDANVLQYWFWEKMAWRP